MLLPPGLLTYLLTNFIPAIATYSALYGEYEDFREDMRNKKMLKKKKA